MSENLETPKLVKTICVGRLDRRDKRKGVLVVKSKPKEIIEKIGSKPILASLFIFVLASVIVISLTLIKYGYKGDFYKNILIEAHGMLFDILVIGIFIFALHKIGESRIKRELDIKRWEEEIDDFRGWNEKEATFRIVGNIRRLNRNGTTDIDLRDSFLEEASLEEIDLRDAILTRANLRGASLFGADLRGADLSPADLRGADLSSADLRGADLIIANLADAKLWKADLRGADLRRTKLWKADLGEADLRGATLLTIEQLSKVKTLFQAILDPELEKEVKQKYPHLLELPKFPKEEVDE